MYSMSYESERNKLTVKILKKSFNIIGKHEAFQNTAEMLYNKITVEFLPIARININYQFLFPSLLAFCS